MDEGNPVVPDVERAAPIDPRRMKITDPTVPYSGFVFNNRDVQGRHHSDVSADAYIPEYGCVLHTRTDTVRELRIGRADNREECVFKLSILHQHCLNHLCLLGRPSINGIISNRAFFSLDTVFCTLKPDVSPRKTFSKRCSQQFISALTFLHSEKFIHGTLAPRFILFDSADGVKLFLPPHPFFKIDRASPYTAVELRDDRNRDPTMKSDMYSVGSIIYRFYHARDPLVVKANVKFRSDMNPTAEELIKSCWSEEINRPTARQAATTLYSII